MSTRLGYLVLTLALLLGLTGPSAIAEPDEPTLRVAAVGDFSTSAQASGVLQGIGNSEADLAIALGDLSYQTTDEQLWCDFVTSRVGAGYPFELLAGNHESNGVNGHINNFSACLPNQLPGLIGTYGRQYYVDVPKGAPLVRFVMISPGLDFGQGAWSYEAGTPRYAWTAAAIDGARSAGVPWVVVGTHMPCLGVAHYPCQSGPDLLNLLVEKKVDLVLRGHDHVYMRSHQLARSASCPALVPETFNAACVVDADTEMVRGAGTVLATVGTGGVPLRDVYATDSEAGYFSVASGLNANPTWGFLQLTATPSTLTAEFKPTGGGGLVDRFTLAAGNATNQPPVAVASGSCSGLVCTFSGASSTDADGTITSHAWSFGDGTTGSGPTATHSYAAPGSYTATLTVTDDRGAQASATATVVATTPSTPPIARDDFERTVASGWGTAPVGGPWTTSAGASVGGGRGAVLVPRGSTRNLDLPGATARDTDLSLTIGADRPLAGSGLYLTVAGRRVADGSQYRAPLRVLATGKVGVRLARTSATGTETSLTSEVQPPGVTLAAGDRLAVRLQVVGGSPTTLRVKVWVAGQPEPAPWTATTTDGTPGLQTPGSLRLATYISSSSADAAVNVTFDDVLAVAP